MSRFAERGYHVKENAPIYFTNDMDKTARWFEDVLGWYSQIDQRDADGHGSYGCVFSLPPEIEITHLAPFTGIHLFRGEPAQAMLSFLQVQGIDALHAYVTDHGWTEITPIEQQPWGSKTCRLTTIDGYVINIFE